MAPSVHTGLLTAGASRACSPGSSPPPGSHAYVQMRPMDGPSLRSTIQSLFTQLTLRVRITVDLTPSPFFTPKIQAAQETEAGGTQHEPRGQLL